MADTKPSPSIRVLVVADSRGSGLQNCVNSLQERKTTRVVVHRGAGMARAVEKSREILATYRPDLVILMAGICDVTTRDGKSRITSLRHTNTVEAVEYAMEQLQKAVAMLHGLSIFNVSIATYTGVDLVRYNRVKWCSVHRDQDLLNDIIARINSCVVNTNKDAGMPTTWTGGAVHPRLNKRYRNHYDRLTDGCHLTEQTRSYWARQIMKTIRHHPFKSTPTPKLSTQI